MDEERIKLHILCLNLNICAAFKVSVHFKVCETLRPSYKILYNISICCLRDKINLKNFSESDRSLVELEATDNLQKPYSFILAYLLGLILLLWIRIRNCCTGMKIKTSFHANKSDTIIYLDRFIQNTLREKKKSSK